MPFDLDAMTSGGGDDSGGSGAQWLIDHLNDPKYTGGGGGGGMQLLADPNGPPTQVGGDSSLSLIGQYINGAGDALTKYGYMVVGALIRSVGIGPASVALGVAAGTLALLWANSSAKSTRSRGRARGVTGRQIRNARRTIKTLEGFHRQVVQACRPVQHRSSGCSPKYNFHRRRKAK